MQRPCFALAMLLGAMASSVVGVGAAHSPSSVTLGTGLPGPAMVCGIVLGSLPTVVRSQSVDESSGADDESLAARWATLTPTGYDVGFDFAMFEGSFDGIEPSKCEITACISVELLCEEAAIIALEAQPLAAEPVADTEWQLDCSGETMLDDDEPATKFCPWTGRELPMGIEPLSPPTVPADTEAADETSLMHRSIRALQTNWSAAKAWSESLAHHPWLTIVRDEIARTNEPSIDDLFGGTITVEALVVETPAVEDAPPSLELENLLLHTANTLEQLSEQLQHVAKQIRDFANDRIVSRNHLEPVTR